MLEETNSRKENKKRKRSFVNAYTDLKGNEQFSDYNVDSDEEETPASSIYYV